LFFLASAPCNALLGNRNRDGLLRHAEWGKRCNMNEGKKSPPESTGKQSGLNDEITDEDVKQIEESYFKQQVNRGVEAMTHGRVLTHAMLKKGIERWRKSIGRQRRRTT
jgi:hypothetical protein